ncbi:MAG TPA: VOC family protein [Candidatus Binataceae bacterium]|nr:VOC family protein [Candidatus Binataceae bacterium]
MFRISKEFHLLHVVSDLDAADEWYDRIFSVRRFVRNYMKAAMRKASLVLIGDFVMEPAQPVQKPGWEKSALGKFYTRYGQHFHSIAWYVDDLRQTSIELSSHKIRMFDMVGNPVTEAVRGDAVWTHPQDTHAAFEFAIAPKFFIDPRLQPAWSTEFARDQHPLGIERASHITVLFRNLDDARGVYGEALGGKLIHQESSERKQSLFFAVGEDTVIEAVRPLATSSPEGQDLERAGEGIFSVTFKTKDLNRAADHLRAHKQRIEFDGKDTLVINRDDAFGMVIGFTERLIPNDPR